MGVRELVATSDRLAKQPFCLVREAYKYCLQNIIRAAFPAKWERDHDLSGPVKIMLQLCFDRGPVCADQELWPLRFVLWNVLVARRRAMVHSARRKEERTLVRSAQPSKSSSPTQRRRPCIRVRYIAAQIQTVHLFEFESLHLTQLGEVLFILTR